MSRKTLFFTKAKTTETALVFRRLQLKLFCDKITDEERHGMTTL